MLGRTLLALLGLGALAACATGAGWNRSGASLGGGWDGMRSDPFGGAFGRPYGYGSDPFGSRAGAGNGRTFRPGPGVICDRATETCYRRGQIDASETRDVFGRGAAREVDRVRDWAGTNRLYRPSDDVVCNRVDQVCYKNGHPDRSETRDYFGRSAARRID